MGLFERRKSPWQETAYVLLGTLSHSGRTRGCSQSATDQARLIAGHGRRHATPWGNGPQAAHRPPRHGDRARQR